MPMCAVFKGHMRWCLSDAAQSSLRLIDQTNRISVDAIVARTVACDGDCGCVKIGQL